MNTFGMDRIITAERIALPKGENNETYRQDFTTFTGIKIPTPNPGQLSVKSEGRKFYWLRGIDIPEKVDKKLVDIGLVGTDALLDYEGYDQLRSRTIGQPVCRFSVLTTPEDVEAFNKIFAVERRFVVPMAWLPTSRPRALERVCRWNDWPLRAYDLKISGSVEAYADLLPQRKVVADLVKTGGQAAANGLAEAKKLFDVAAKVIARDNI